MEEIKRLFNVKMMMVLVIAIIANTVIYINVQTQGADISFVQENTQYYKQLITEYKENIMGKADIYNSMTNKQLDTIIEDNDILLHQLNSGKIAGNYIYVLKLQNKLEHIRDYPLFMDNIQNNAKSLVHFSIFSDTESFSYNNIIKTSRDFSKLRDTELLLENDLAAESLTDYYIPFCIVLILMLILIYKMYAERENYMWDMIYASENGRGKLAVKRIAAFTIISMIYTFIIYGSTVIAAYILYGGWSSLNSNIQQLVEFSECTFSTTIAGFFFINTIITWCVLWSIAIILWMLFTYARKRSVALMIVCIITGAEAILYNSITSQSIYAVFKTVNIFSLINMGNLLRGYRNWGWGGLIFSTSQTILAIMGIVGLIGLIAIVMGMICQHPHRALSFLLRQITSIIKKMELVFQRALSFCGQGIMEEHKLLITSRGILIVILALFLSIYFCNSTKMHFSEGMIHKDEMYLEMGGKDYSKLTEYVEEVVLNYDTAMNNFNEAKEKLETGEIDENKYMYAIMEMQTAKEKYAFAAEFIEKGEYLEELSQKGIQGYMISERGYEEIFGEYSQKRELILLLAAVIGCGLIIMENISMEYFSGMEQLVRSTSKGRENTIIKKITAGIVVAVILYILIYTIDYIFLWKFYGLPYTGAPLVSLMFMRDSSLNITIGTYLVFKLLSKLCLVIFAVGLMVFISVLIGKSKQKSLAMVFIGALIVFVLLYMQLSDRLQFMASGMCAAAGMLMMTLAVKLWSR